MSDDVTYYVKDNTSGEYVEAQLPSPPAFHETLPEDIRGNEALKEISDAPTLAQKYIEARSKVPVVPGAANDYLFEFPDGFSADENELTGFQELAHELGLTQDQYGKALNFQVQRELRIAEALNNQMAASRTAAEDSLKKEWGVNYDQNLELAKQVFKRFSDDATTQFMEDTKFGNNPQVLRLFHQIGTVLSEDVLKSVRKPPPLDGGEKDEAGRSMLDFSKSMP